MINNLIFECLIIFVLGYITYEKLTQKIKTDLKDIIEEFVELRLTNVPRVMICQRSPDCDDAMMFGTVWKTDHAIYYRDYINGELIWVKYTNAK